MRPSAPVPQQWFARWSVPGDVTVLWEPHVHWFIRANFFHVLGSDDCLLVDSGLGLARLNTHLADLLDRPAQLLLTHGHYDHAGGAFEFEDRIGHLGDDAAFRAAARPRLRRRDFPRHLLTELEERGYAIPHDLLDAHPRTGFDAERHVACPAAPYRAVDDGEEIEAAGRSFRVVHLPGHSPGSIGLFEERTGYLFSGDVIYDGPLFDSLPESSRHDYVKSVRTLRRLPVTLVFPGHGPILDRRRMVALIDRYLASMGAP